MRREESINFKYLLWSVWFPAIAPAVIAGLIGGGIVSWATPFFQTMYASKQINQLDRVKLWKSIGSNLTDYRTKIELLDKKAIDVSLLTNEQIKASGYYQHIRNIVHARNKYRKKLLNNFEIAQYYFKGTPNKLIAEFIIWDQNNIETYVGKNAKSILKLHQAWIKKSKKDINKYQKWQSLIMNSILSQL